MSDTPRRNSSFPATRRGRWPPSTRTFLSALYDWALYPAEHPAVRAANDRFHVVDGTALLWQLPDMPPLAAIVGFEHHLRQGRTGYPEAATLRDRKRTEPAASAARGTSLADT